MTTEISINKYMSEGAVKQRFEELLGKKAPGFISSIISAVNNNDMLKNAERSSIMNAAAKAAALDLPIDSNLGFAAIVPYRDTKANKTLAQFQIMYKGFIQLAQRSGQFKTINATPVYEGELVKNNRLTGEMVFDEAKRTSDKVVGYAGYMELINGFSKTLFMPTEELDKHGKRFSKSYQKGYGLWKDDFHSMAIKTVIKQLLSKYAPLSIDMQNAVTFDQSIINNEGQPQYIDNDATIIDDSQPIEAKRPEAIPEATKEKEESNNEPKLKL